MSRREVNRVELAGARAHPLSRTRRILVVSSLALVLVAQAAWFAGTTSGTYDETTYLRLGRGLYEQMDTGAFAGWGVAPLPVILTSAAPELAGAASNYPREIALARTSAIILFGLPLVALIFWTLFHAFGEAAAVAGTAILVLSPNIVAHASLATTDVCFMTAALGALAALVHHLETRSWASYTLLGVALAVALAAKYSALGLFPVVAVASFVTSGGQSKSLLRRAADAAALSIGFLVTSLVFVWGLHAFSLEPWGLPPIEEVRLPASVVGIGRQIHHQSLGEPSFLLGQHSNSGWWYYIPVALAMKSTPVELVVWVAALFALVRGWPSATPSGIVWRLAFVIFAAAGLVNRIAFGIRYVLLLFPLAVFLAAEQWLGAGRTRKHSLTVPGVLVALQLFSAVTIAPHYLSYFNAFSGGPEEGPARLADSNVDWGQDLPALKIRLDSLGAKHPLLSYFGTAPVGAYGVDAAQWDAGVRDQFERWDWVAISATNLDGVFLPADPFADFRPLAPDARAGYSILLFSTKRADVRKAMATAASRLQ